MKKLGRALILGIPVFFVGWAGWAGAAPLVKLDTHGIEDVPPRSVEVLEDVAAALTVAQVLAEPWRERFQPRTKEHLNFGSTRSAIWLRFVLHNRAAPRDWILLVDNPRVEHAELYVHRADGSIERAIGGDRVPMTDRAMEGREVAFPLQLAPGETAAVYVRIVTSVTLSVTLAVLTPDGFQRQSRVRTAILTTFLGSMAMLAVIAFGLWVRHRDLRYFVYFCMVASALGMFVTQDGVSTELLWPEHPEWTWNIRAFASLLMSGAIVSFIVLSLDVKRTSAFLYWLGMALAAGCVASALVFPLLPGQFANRALYLLASGILFVTLSSIALAVRNRHPLGVMFLASFLPLAIAIGGSVIHNLTWIAGPTRLIVDGFKLAMLLFAGIQLIGLRAQVRREEQSLAKHRSQVDAWQGTLPTPPAAPPPRLVDKPVLIHTLGKIEVWREQTRVFFSSRGPSRAQLLLALLLAAGRHGTTKAQAMDQLWPEADGDLAGQSLRTTLYRLRKAIGPDALDSSAGHLRLNPDLVWDDGSQFETVASQWLERLRAAPTLAAVEEACAAVRLYAGDFLPAVDLPAVQARRNRLRGLFQSLLLRAAEGYLTLHRLREAVELYRLAEHHGVLNEIVYQGLMRCQTALGHALEALQTYERCKAWLEETLGIPPSPDTERLRALLPGGAQA